jgi:hypothetical protein
MLSYDTQKEKTLLCSLRCQDSSKSARQLRFKTILIRCAVIDYICFHCYVLKKKGYNPNRNAGPSKIGELLILMQVTSHGSSRISSVTILHIYFSQDTRSLLTLFLLIKSIMTVSNICAKKILR